MATKITEAGLRAATTHRPPKHAPLQRSLPRAYERTLEKAPTPVPARRTPMMMKFLPTLSEDTVQDKYESHES